MTAKNENFVRSLGDTTVDDRITPEEFQRRPNSAGAVEPDHLDRTVDTPAATDTVHELRTPERERELTTAPSDVGDSGKGVDDDNDDKGKATTKSSK